MLLASNVQSGDKHSYLNRNLYDPGDILGSWNNKPSSWDCRQVLKFIYKSHLLLEDGFHEIALVSASSAVEKSILRLYCIWKIIIFKAQREIKSHTFKQRASQLIKNYGYPLPSELLSGLIDAYAARNDIAHQLSSYSPEKVAIHIAQLENVIEWYYKNIQ
jgi:HEPN domain-containing protein